jgi:hypothetical protein
VRWAPRGQYSHAVLWYYRGPEPVRFAHDLQRRIGALEARGGLDSLRALDLGDNIRRHGIQVMCVIQEVILNGQFYEDNPS